MTRDLGRSVSTFSRSVKLFSTGDGCVPVKWSNLVLLRGHAKKPKSRKKIDLYVFAGYPYSITPCHKIKHLQIGKEKRERRERS